MITPNLLSISTGTAHILVNTGSRSYSGKTEKQTLVPGHMDRITLRHHKGAFITI